MRGERRIPVFTRHAPAVVLVGALVAACCIGPVSARLVGAHGHPSDNVDIKKSTASKSIASQVVLKRENVPEKEKSKKAPRLSPPVAKPFRHTTHLPPSGASGPLKSLILLGPWNGTAGFFDDWLLSDFAKVKPDVKKSYRILDCVGAQRPTDAGNPYAYNSWYEYEDWHTETPVPTDVDQAVMYVHALIEQEYAIVGDYKHIVLAGFSQGANVALEAALRFHSPLGLVFSQRGILLQARKDDWHTAIATSPYILTAGADDDVYTVDRAMSNCRWLQRMGTTAYLKTLPALDHYRRSKGECQLAIKSFAAVASSTSADLADLTEWTDCHG